MSLAGTHMQFVALPYFVHEQTGSAFATGLAAAAHVMPGVTLGPLAGAVADSRDSRRLLVAANFVLAAVTVAFCLTLVAPWWVVLPVALLQGVVAQLIGPAEIVLVPTLVPATGLPAANSLMGANHNLARLLGPAVGGVLYATSGLPLVALANALTFAFAAVLVSRIGPATHRPCELAQSPTRLDGRPGRPPVMAGWATGWAEIRRQPLLGRLLAMFVLAGMGEGCVAALLAPYTAEVFGSSTALGLLLTCQAAGGLAGALVVSRWAVLGHVPQTLARAAIACAILLAAMIGYPMFYPRLWPALLLIAVAGFPFAVVAAAQTTLLQTLPSPAVRGRVFGVAMAAAGAAQLIGILASGYLADRTSVYFLLADAPCYLLAGLIMLRSRRRHGPPTRQD